MVDSFIIGLSIASILLIVALGLAIIYGTMGVINLAHGEMVMIGAYATVLGQMYLGLDLYWCLPIAFIVTAALGYAIERFLIRRLYGRLVDTVLVTWGIVLILQQLVRIDFGLTFFGIDLQGLGPGLQSVPVPVFLREAFTVGPITLGVYRVFIFLVAAVSMAVTWWILMRTSIGRQVRAVTRNRDMAACCGIPGEMINRFTFAYGAGLAGIAGVLVSGFKTVSPSMGTPYVVDAFLVVVAGGVGNIFGALGAALILGELSSFVSFETNEVYGRVATLVAVILILLVRPQGLFSYRIR